MFSLSICWLSCYYETFSRTSTVVLITIKLHFPCGTQKQYLFFYSTVVYFTTFCFSLIKDISMLTDKFPPRLSARVCFLFFLLFSGLTAHSDLATSVLFMMWCRGPVSPARGWRKISPIGWMNETPFWPSAVASSVSAASPPVTKCMLWTLSQSARQITNNSQSKHFIQ